MSKYVTDPRIKKLLLSRDEGKDKKERGGIGTPATRGAMLAKLLGRNYYGVDNNKLIPTKHGLQFHDALPAIATKPDMTALWHEQQQLIESGELSCDEFLDEVETFIAQQIAAVDLGTLQGFSVTAKCLMCGGIMAPKGNVVGCEACEFKVFREICGKELSEEQMHQLLTTARTGLIKGMRGHKEGSKAFDASLKLTAEGTVEFVFPKTKSDDARPNSECACSILCQHLPFHPAGQRRLRKVIEGFRAGPVFPCARLCPGVRRYRSGQQYLSPDP